LLAFNKIVATHPFLVAEQEDVILECIDSEDITIRIKALDLVQGMVSSDNLISIVGRLMRQLKAASPSAELNGLEDSEQDSSDEANVDPKRRSKPQEPLIPLPEDYTIDVIGRILKMCSQNNYANIVDFDWYIDVLTQLVRIAPTPPPQEVESDSATSISKLAAEISERIGNELRNVAVKAKAVRPAAVRAAELIISRLTIETSITRPALNGALKPVAWVVGEYASLLASADDALRNLQDLLPRIRDPEILATCLQAVLKLFAYVAGNDQIPWTSERKSMVSLLMARVIHVIEKFVSHPYLEVQERAVEFVELLKLTAEAAAGQTPSTAELHQDPPLLLTQAIPSLFAGWELNSVAQGAQYNVPIPDGLDLDEPIHPDLPRLLAQADSLSLPDQSEDEFAAYYHQKPPITSISSTEPAINKLGEAPEYTGSYQQHAAEESYLDPDIIARRKAERMERYRDDPFYIPPEPIRSSTPIHNILQKENGPDLDIDSIPIMQLDLGPTGTPSSTPKPIAAKPKPRQRIVVAADETLSTSLPNRASGTSTPRSYDSDPTLSRPSTAAARKAKQQSLLQVDSSHLESLSLDASESAAALERQQREEAEMQQALREVQRLRLEMQRANERIMVAQAKGVTAEGVVVASKPKKKKKDDKEKRAKVGESEGVEGKVKKKKKKAVESQKAEGSGTGSGTGTGEGASEPAAVGVVKKKRSGKAKRLVQLDDREEAGGSQ